MSSFMFSLFNVCPFFKKFLSRSIRMIIPIVKGAENGSINRLKNGRILIKNVLLKFNFQNEGHLDKKF